ncbi:MAG: recombination mediator RecR [Clostridia bacterium]|nr:recombination mediator RecR [Clostridia bacterium]MDD7673004.1 recombination mediator RecR [Clostridia bacterium]MDY2929472.1 recombination mediator RecR [Clostridiaceae bacterium]
MQYYAAPLEALIEQFQRLPGIGHKSAQRLAFYVLGLPEGGAEAFAQAILDARGSIHTCRVCQNLTEGELCPICADPTRDAGTICVVTDPKDLIAIERTREYHGLYHVLHGVISPLSDVGPEQLKIKELLQRVAQGDVKEIIMATNPDTEGETTALYIGRLLKPFGVKVTRLAYGVPVGGHLEFSDEVTLTRALEGRREL